MVPDALTDIPDVAGPRLRVAILGGIAWVLLCLGAGALVTARGALLPVLTPDDFDGMRIAGLVAFAFGALLAGPRVDRKGGRIVLSVATLGAGLAFGAAGLAVRLLNATPAAPPFPPAVVLGALSAAGLFLAGAASIAWFRLGVTAFPSANRGTFLAAFGILATAGVLAAVPVDRAVLALAAPQSPDGAAVPHAPFLLAAALLVVAAVPVFLGLRGADAARASPAPTFRSLVARPASWMLAGSALCAGVLLGGAVEGLPAFAGDYWVLPPSSLATLSLTTIVAILLGAALAGIAARRYPGRPPRVVAVFLGLALLGTLGMLPSMGERPPIVGWADEEAVPLRPGDMLLSVNGSPITADHSWAAVAGGYRCMRSVCKGEGVLWDLARCECSRAPVQAAAAPIATGGNIRFQVIRNGETVLLKIDDPLPYADAYQARVLPAGPELTVPPVVLCTFALLVAMTSFASLLLLAGAAAPSLAGRQGAATLAGAILAFATLGFALPVDLLGDMANRDWHEWPLALLPVALVGVLLSWRAGQKR